jgi:hypothetical protein
VNPDTLSLHYQKDRYGDFWLTEAVRPSPGLEVVPREGYRLDTYCDDQHGLAVPVLAASVSREKLFDAFLALLDPLDDLLDVVLETSHDSAGDAHRDLHREHIDKPVLISVLCEFEDLLLHDGCTGIAIVSRERPIEVQFDEHKLLMVYAENLRPFRRALRDLGVPKDDQLRVLTEEEHLHGSHPRHATAFQQFGYRLGVEEPAEHVNW